ncbi:MULTISPECIES: hypothetical protein [Niastella]|uniref:CRISPR-associated protein Cas7 n=1 Tax=Niastella soli TaxID=2821487 RepID=A0ABS3YX72_9BACT|nr:hypothetical protein [Niastella soli]MBO9202529.1 hypothetical protein [Niastella soli]
MQAQTAQSPYLFIRGLKRVDHTVFCVQDGQKFYYDALFKDRFGNSLRLPYSSGQQVKRSILQSFLTKLNKNEAPTTFVFDGVNLEEGEVLSVCDPSYPDQLIGGWMSIPKGGKERAVKRRSPLSISAMRPLHPLLVGYTTENVTFDRSNKPELHRVIVRDSQGKQLTDDQIEDILAGTARSLRRKWIPNKNGSGARTSGLFVYDVVIDLRTLFCVSLNSNEPELRKDENESNLDKTIFRLKKLGWKEGTNDFGKCLICPKKDQKDKNGKILQLGRDSIIKALAEALLDWRITTNQARTLDIQSTLAISISDNANKIAAAIRSKLVVESEEPKAVPIVAEKLPGIETFVTLAGAGYLVTTNETYDALDKAQKRLTDLMLAFDYENQ